jgi:hypothetical protein
VIVEVQKKVDNDAIGRVIRYSLNVFDDTGSYLYLVEIAIDVFSSKGFRDTTFNKKENDPFYTHSCQSWEESAKFYTPEFITNNINTNPSLDKMIALCHVFFMQENNIMLLKNYDDTCIQSIYKVALKLAQLTHTTQQSLEQMYDHFVILHR